MITAADSAMGIAQAVRRGEQSARDIILRCVERLEAVDDRLNAFRTYDPARALSRADVVDQAIARGDDAGPLLGVPVAIKDNICTDFGETSCGSRILEHFRSQYNAFVVDRLEAAGAIIVGKTNLDEFAMGSSTENSAYGPTRNPWDVSRVPGGSSGGSTAAVAARVVPVALGSDTGGSIRLPAAFCGVVGLKPTYGRVSRYGLVAFGSSLDQIGPIARHVYDAALVLSVIAGHDSRDSTCANVPVPDYPARLDQRLDGIRLGVSEEYFGGGCDPVVRDAVQRAIALLEQHGADVIAIEMPHMRLGVACYYTIATAEASSNLARFDGVRYGHRTRRPADIHDMYAMTRGDAFGAEVKRRIMLGTFALSSGYYDAYYVKALKVRKLIAGDFARAFERVDAIVSPVAPTTAFALGEKSEDPLAMYLADVYTIAANLAGLCAITIPCGFDAMGLPIGLQFMGRSFGEEKLLAIAHEYQSRTEHHLAAPRLAVESRR